MKVPTPRLFLALAALLATTAYAQPEAGVYLVEGRTVSGGSYSGETRIARADGTWTAEVRREGGPTLSGRLAQTGNQWVLEAPTDPGNAEGPVLELAYRQAEEGRLTTRWRIRAGGAPTDEGEETLHWFYGREDAPPGDLSENPPRVKVSVSVDWEGRDILPEDIQTMEEFRTELPDVPLTHFLNSAYFTKTDANSERIVEMIRRTLRPGDETGLHVHAWKSLVEASGVPFRSGPTFWGDHFPLEETGGDRGHEVELCAYEPSELASILDTSVRILEAQGFEISRSFRAGGWLADARVLQAVRSRGFWVDSSATTATWHEELEEYRLRDRIREVWPDVTSETEPYLIETPVGHVLEMPDTGALADYTTAEEVLLHLSQAAERLKANPSRDIHVQVGFHQETARNYAARVAIGIRAARELHPDSFAFETLESAALRVRENLPLDR